MRVPLSVFATLLTIQIVGSYETSIGIRSYKPAIVLAYTNLPPMWELQGTTDLTNWYSILRSGEAAPKEIGITLNSSNQSQYYRLVDVSR